jgi:hypothetical protein
MVIVFIVSAAITISLALVKAAEGLSNATAWVTIKEPPKRSRRLSGEGCCLSAAADIEHGGS